MKKVIYKGKIYTVEETMRGFYKLSGDLLVHRSDCKEMPQIYITIERVGLALAIGFIMFHVSRILIIEIAKIIIL